MARGVPVRLDHAGLAQALKSAEMAEAVRARADEVAENARGQGLTASGGESIPVEVEEYTTDRAAASVTLAHAAGMGMQAKYGVLTKAAAEAGLEVTEKTDG